MPETIEQAADRIHSALSETSRMLNEWLAAKPDNGAARSVRRHIQLALSELDDIVDQGSD